MLSALVLLPVALLCVWFGGLAFTILVGIASYLMAREWLAMCGHTGSEPVFLWFPNIFAVIAFGAGLGWAGAGWIAGVVAATVINVFVRWPGRPRHGDSPGERAGLWVGLTNFDPGFGLLWLGPAAFALPWLRADPVAGLANTLFILAIVWGSDIGAYLVGRLVGGPKLAPAISPGKTWSGAIGGLVSGVLASLTVAACFSSEVWPSHLIGPSIVLGIISQAGDLLESGLKRHFGVKDSGHIIPGHGGLLDRLDALLAVAPVAALLAFTVGRGVVLWR